MASLLGPLARRTTPAVDLAYEPTANAFLYQRSYYYYKESLTDHDYYGPSTPSRCNSQGSSLRGRYMLRKGLDPKEK